MAIPTLLLRLQRNVFMQNVTIDVTNVVSRFISYKGECVNAFPWRRWKGRGQELCVADGGMAVQLGKTAVWGMTAEDMVG